MKTIKKDLLFMTSIFLVILLSLVWLGVDYESRDEIFRRIFVTICILGIIFLFFILGERSGQGDYLLMENIKKGTSFKVISSLKIPNKKPHCFYVIELQNGTFSILSLEHEKWEDADRVLQAGKSYYVDTTKGSLVMI
jgi:hypothetical protein